MTPRRIKAVRAAQRHDVGNLYTRLAFSIEAAEQLDPFLLLAHHGPQQFPPNSVKPAFGAHPHRGFETVTFILDGELLHADSGGHESLIHGGGVQWMTAGAGVVHEEAAPDSFWRNGGSLEMLQLWVNLPSRLKMTPPRYTGIEASGIPTIPLAGDAGALALISGEYAGTSGPAASLTDIFMSTVSLRAGAHGHLPAPDQRTVLFYITRGDVVIDGRKLGAGDLVMFDEQGDTVDVESSGGAHILFGHGQAIGEPVVAAGPFVMNSKEEIEQAYEDYRSGKFEAAS